MRPGRLFVLAALVLIGCVSQEVGIRYRAERDLLQADRQYQLLSALPARTVPDRWKALAAAYAQIAARSLPAASTGPAPVTPVRRQLQELSARALFTAAQIHAALQDSVRVDQIFQQMATAFAGLPDIAGEVSLSRGRIAESRGELDRAIEHYSAIVQGIEANPGAPGIAGAVLGLPLRIARLQAQQAGAPGDSAFYATARGYYRRILAQNASLKLTAGARGYLADIAIDLGEWRPAAQILDRLESELTRLPEAGVRPRDPAEVRLAAVQARLHLYTSRDSMQAEVDALLRDYPHGEVGPRARFALAEQVRKLGRPQEALEILEGLLRDCPTAQIVPDAMEAQAQLLDQLGRWGTAIGVYRSLRVGYSVSLPALRSQLAIADHYQRAGNAEARTEALEQAARAYRAFLVRYPENPYTYRAWELLIQTLTLQQRHADALEEMLKLSERVAGSSKEPQLLMAAAHTAATQVGDTARAIAILEQTAQRLPQTRIGVWSAHEAQRLRGRSAP